jgi:hypothetical protein
MESTMTFRDAWERTPRAGKIFWIIIVTIVGVIVLSFAIWPDGSFPVQLWGL